MANMSKGKGKGDDPAYQPRMTDPASGRKLVRGRPVANAGPTKAPDFTKAKTVQPVARVTAPKPFGGPPVAKADIGRVKDPVSGDPMKKGSPVPNAYSGSMNQKVGLNLDAAGKSLAAGFQPPAGQKAGKGDAALPTPKQRK